VLQQAASREQLISSKKKSRTVKSTRKYSACFWLSYISTASFVRFTMITMALPATSDILVDDHASLDTEAPKTLPIIDFYKFLLATSSTNEKLEVGTKLVSAFHEYDLVFLTIRFGFIYLKNFGVDPTQSEKMFKASKAFFDLSLEEKLEVEWLTAESNRGYVPRGKEKNTELDKAGRQEEIKELRLKNPDMKESFEIGKESSDNKYENRWPSSLPAFKETSMQFFEDMQRVNVELMRAISLGLGLEEHVLDSFVSKSDNNLRLLHYPV
jgi:isopenicillin N synthase-like dioxygenase